MQNQRGEGDNGPLELQPMPSDGGGTSAAGTANSDQNLLRAAAAAGADAAGRNVSVPTILKARPRLRDVDEGRQFTPVAVSIGAYHRDDGHLNGEKGRVADRVCAPNGIMRSRVLAELQNELRNTSAHGRDWYPDINAPADYFSLSAGGSRNPLLDDGCFVLRFLVNYGDVHDDGAREEYERIMAGNKNSVMRDILFLLENQLPWSVLRGMHRWIRDIDRSSFREEMENCIGHPIETDSDPDRARALELALDKELAGHVQDQLADRLCTIKGEVWRRPVPSPAPAHLLHLVHHYLKPTGQEHLVNMVEGRRMGRWRRATEYRRHALVQLKPREFKQGEVESVLDVRLDGGTLRIPTLLIDDLTCTILRNLIALEDRLQMSERPVTAYCIFMSQLACKVEDVELLQRLGILHNFLPTDEDVIKDLGDLCKGVVFRFDDPRMNYLNGTWHELQKRCQTEPINFFGLFFEKYCSNSVHTLAFLAAATLFAFQAAQLVFAILSYVHRR